MERAGEILCDTDDGYLVVAVGDGAQMTCPTGDVVWKLTYGNAEAAALTAASAIESYSYLVYDCSEREALRRIKIMRKARRESLKKKNV